MNESSEKPKTKAYSRRQILRLTGAAIGGATIGSLVGIGGVKLIENLSTKQEVDLKRHLPPFPEFELPNPDQKILVIPLKEAGEGIVSQEDVESYLENVSKYYERNSYGKFRYSYTVLPPREVDLPTDRDDVYKVTDKGDVSLDNSEKSRYGTYQTRLYIVNPDKDQKAGGYKIDPKEGYRRAVVYYVSNGIIIHELGHTLGLGHADLLTPSVEGDYTNGVKLEEYAGSGNFMGDIFHNIKPREGGIYFEGLGLDFNAAQKVELGWLVRKHVKDVTQSGEYVISAIAHIDDPVTTKALRIRKPDTGEVYWVDFRPYYFGSVAPSLEIVKWDEKAGSPTNQIKLDPREGIRGNVKVRVTFK